MSLKLSSTAFLLSLVFLTLTGLGTITQAATNPQYETPTVFYAPNILPAKILQGEDYKIRNSVYNDGLQNRYEISTSFGHLTVEGGDLLMIRLQEIRAIRQMEELKRTDTYGTALKNAALGPLRFAKGMVTHPIDTTSNVATGVGKWFSNIGHSMWGGASDREEGTFKTFLGFDTVKRKFAFQFGVDPYSSYGALQERLNDVSWTAFAGSMTVKVAFMAIPGVGGTVLSATGFSKGMSKLIADKTPAELKDLNEEKLKAMGVHESLAEVFLEHPQFSPTQTTHLVGALEQMRGVGSREIFIQKASLAQTETFAFYRRKQAEMFAAYHKKVTPGERFIRVGRTPYLMTKNAKLVLTLPVDHVAWTKRIALLATKDLEASGDFQVRGGKELWVGGTMSAFARQKFEAEGWVVKEKISSQLRLK